MLELERARADGVQIQISVTIQGELTPEAHQLLEELTDGLREMWEQDR